MSGVHLIWLKGGAGSVPPPSLVPPYGTGEASD
jgi:hypothetical protein